MASLPLDPELLDELEEALRDRGALLADEMALGWSLSEEQCELALRELARRPGVRRKPGLGRDRLVLEIDRIDREEDGAEAERGAGGGAPEDELPAAWQRRSVDRLVELLRYREIEELLGGLLFTLRRARRAETGEDRRGTKRELATALVLRHGVDLLADPGVRRAVGRAAGVTPPGRWHPGKAAATAFVRRAGFPPELAGRPLPSSPPSLEFLDAHLDLPPLAPFQREVLREMLMCLYPPAGGRAMVSLPTGAGKTRVAVEGLVTWLLERWDHESEVADRGVVIWLAHTEELCEQAIACFQDVWQGVDRVAPTTLARFWGSYSKKEEEVEELRAALRGAAVLVSTPNRLVSLVDGEEELVAEIRKRTGLVVIDEAHRAAAPTYRRLLAHFDGAEHSVSVLGLTATPYRMEYDEDDPLGGTEELRRIFAHLIEPRRTLGHDPRRALQEMGVLARPRIETLRTDTAIRLDGGDAPLDQEAIERLDQLLALRTDRTPRRLQILEGILPLTRDPSHQILYFGPSVQDAECMAFLLQRRGVPAGVVSGTSKRSARRQAIEQFREGMIRVLCNCEVLTTGFDAPRVTHVVMGRPTVSQVLYEQMVGRGLRGARFGGTETCVILDCVDDYRGERPQLGYEGFRAVWDPGGVGMTDNR